MARPSKYDKIDKGQIEKLAKAGWTDAQMSDFFGVTEQTWNNWKKKHKSFFESLKDWKAEADHKVERSLYERATGYSHPHDDIRTVSIGDGMSEITITPTVKHHPPDTTAAIFWLKNRKPDQWRDKQEHEHGGEGGGPIRFTFNLGD